jgi:DNA adenine methylase
VQIENVDAVYLIGRMDTPNTFFYIDPPYVGANQGHYGGYMQSHFETLSDKLATIKGKFLLSSYPNMYLSKMAAKNGWNMKEMNMILHASRNSNKRKIEVLTANYPI